MSTHELTAVVQEQRSLGVGGDQVHVDELRHEEYRCTVIAKIKERARGAFVIGHPSTKLGRFSPDMRSPRLERSLRHCMDLVFYLREILSALTHQRGDRFRVFRRLQLCERRADVGRQRLLDGRFHCLVHHKRLRGGGKNNADLDSAACYAAFAVS